MKGGVMKRNRFVRVLMFAPIAVAVAALLGFVIMWLWNWLMPSLFGLHTIGYWQAVGLFFLSKLLFGGFRGGRGHRMHWRDRMMERMEKMTPEEREKFRDSMRRCWGPFGMSEDPKPGTEQK
jgi:Ca2+/H+ antiporter, TMEM165/GDT1 family